MLKVMAATSADLYTYLKSAFPVYYVLCVYLANFKCA